MYIVIFLFLYGMTSFGLSLYTSLINKQIIEYKNIGQEIFQYYSAINIEYMSMKDRALKKDAFDAGLYTVYGERLGQMKKLEYKDGSGLYVDFMTVRNGVIFGNVCEIQGMLGLAGYSVDQCMQVAENNLQHGVQSFLFYMSSNVDFFRASSSYILDMPKTQDMETGMSICNSCLEYLLQKWTDHFLDMMTTLKRNIIIICSGLFIMQVIIYIILV